MAASESRGGEGGTHSRWRLGRWMELRSSGRPQPLLRPPPLSWCNAALRRRLRWWRGQQSSGRQRGHSQSPALGAVEGAAELGTPATAAAATASLSVQRRALLALEAVQGRQSLGRRRGHSQSPALGAVEGAASLGCPQPPPSSWRSATLRQPFGRWRGQQSSGRLRLPPSSPPQPPGCPPCSPHPPNRTHRCRLCGPAPATQRENRKR